MCEIVDRARVVAMRKGLSVSAVGCDACYDGKPCPFIEQQEVSERADVGQNRALIQLEARVTNIQHRGWGEEATQKFMGRLEKWAELNGVDPNRPGVGTPAKPESSGRGWF